MNMQYAGTCDFQGVYQGEPTREYSNCGCAQYNHSYCSAENRSSTLYDLRLVFVTMWSSRPSLWRIDLEFHDNNYTWETCNMKYIDSLPIVIHLITISRHIHTRGHRTWPKYRSPPGSAATGAIEIKANFVIIGHRNSSCLINGISWNYWDA